MNNIAIIGAGTTGTAVAQQLSLNKTNSVTLFVKSKKQSEQIKKEHRNKEYFQNFRLNKQINSEYNFELLKEFKIILIAIPSHSFKDYQFIFESYIDKDALIINMSKGLLDQGKTIHDYFTIDLKFKNFISLKGPSFNVEVIRNAPTLLTMSYKNRVDIIKVKEIFRDTVFFFDFTSDNNGAEYLCALNNIYAVYMGNIDGKFNSSNTNYFILTQCFKEIKILLKYLKCDTKTANLGCGIGNLCLNSLSDLSRNRTLGLIVEKGFYNADDKTNNVVLEDIKTLNLLHKIIEPKLIKNLPILDTLFNFFIFKTTKTLNVDFSLILKNKFKTVITYGTFDLLHYGHLEILKRSKDYGHKLIVGLSTDEFNEVKGKTCKFNYKKRKRYLESLDFVDLVIPEDNWEQKSQDIVEHRVDFFVMGDDWEGKFNHLEDFCEVIYLPRTKGVSTSQLKQLLNG
ncbi:glycerol-3-phosphate cytidylyltransferase [Winogradskyella eckloniae]|uniref:glycerol-3-phosphate cytidylyltransferase n=1 Tax=Winogradskyella eckloniae TaxID=1089306 RepID=UPI001564ED68|nr:glycerol-3-phosphate cytidylyltransferase [Winogradskyella eckloniae]NRD20332.1 glycerol-3-phosphate cytidylyltransferase [Winogradskyella eckloniae]